MKSTRSPHSKPHNWAQSGRPIQPYRLDPVMIVNKPLDPREQEIVDASNQPYTYEPIHTAVRKLTPGAGTTFVAFATEFGLHEFAGWIASAVEKEWTAPGSFRRLDDLLDRYATGFRGYTPEELHLAWNTLPEDAVRLQTQALQDAFASAAEAPEGDYPALPARRLLQRGWEADVFHIDLVLDETGDVAIICERPQHIWARAWFELVDDMRAGRLPKTCARCGEYFVPRRRNKRFCSDICQNRAYDAARANDPKRRAARHAEYLRRKEAARGSTPQAEEPRGDDQ